MNDERLLEKINDLTFKYNSESKREFLRMVNKNSPSKTTKLYMAVLSKTIDKAETINNKEWMNFSEKMVDSAFINIEAKSIITLQSYLSIIRHYLVSTTPTGDDLKIGHSYTLQLTKDDLTKYINNIGEKYRYVTPKEFDTIIKNGYGDASCKAILILLYLGVKGHRFSDIYEIKVSDIDLETGIIQKDNKELCKIPEKYIGIFKEAIENQVYSVFNNKGELLKENALDTSTEYFLKRKMWRKNDSTIPPNSDLVSNRLLDIQKSIRNPYVTGVTIYNSGVAYKLLEYCDMKMPQNKQLVAFRKATGYKLSYVAMNTICEILLEKLKVKQAL